MYSRIHTVLAFVIGLAAFSLLGFMPSSAAAATRSGFIMQKTDGTPEIWQMDGTGVALGFDFDLPSPTGSGWKIVGIGDFDGDGNPDVLWQNADGTPGIWFLNGTRVVQMVGLSNPGSFWKIVGVGDFNGDGKADILWQNTDGTPGIWLMNGTTPIAEAGLSNPGTGWKPVATGDFNGDGRSDIVWQYSDGTPMIWLMNGATGIGQVMLSNPGSAWKIIAAGDFNGDGQADILWQGTNGQPGIWLMNGTTPFNESGLKNPGTSWQIITAGAFGAPAPLPIQANDGHVQITAVGGIQTVFNYNTDSCDPINDNPDSSYFAFRSADGMVHLTGNNWPGNYRMNGSSLDSVQRSCAPTYVSPQDPVGPDLEYREWLVSPYTLDGTTVYALTHDEWYCNDGSGISGITLLVSTNGGATYAHPQNYKIAGPPASWNGSCPFNYGTGFSNIVSKGGYYYAFYVVGGFTCMMRTTNLADASSWQALANGTWQPLSAQCDVPPALSNGYFPFSVEYSTYLNAFVALLFGPQGVFYSTSTDLINWSPQQSMLAFSPGGTDGFGQANGLTLIYSSLLDPNSNQNFETIGQQAYLYQTYLKPNGNRDMIRQQIKFTILN